MYPIIVLLLMESNNSLDTTIFSSGSIMDARGGQTSRASRMEPMSFAAGPVLATGSQIETATKPPDADIHISFGIVLEPDDSGIDDI